MMTRILTGIGIVAFGLAVNSSAAGESNAPIATSVASNGLSIGAVIQNGAVDTNPIVIVVKAKTNESSLIYIPRPEYFVRLELFDSNNQRVAKVKRPINYGEQFDQLRWDLDLARPAGGGRPKAAGITDKWTGVSTLPSVTELFSVSTPGTYRLKMEVQAMVLYSDMKQKQTHQIIRFPALEMTVTRPEIKSE